MRAATIDIGTNSVLLLVGERTAGGRVRVVSQRATITRLGQGVDRTGRLQPEAIARTLAALRQYAAELQDLGVSCCAAVGTSALRDATDSAAFTRPAERTLGCPVEVIDGQREAALTLRGVASTFGLLRDDAVVFDVGGGSTEFVAAGPRGWRVSLNVGTVRLTERFAREDPPAPHELEAIATEVRVHLGQLPAGSAGTAQLIGVAGTVTTLLTIQLSMDVYDSERVNGGQLDRKQVAWLRKRLSALPLAERKKVTGLDPGRADVIVAGVVLVGQVMDYLGVETLHVCDRGVRWGLLLELLDAGSCD